jgi:hypothetical protein
MIKLVPDWAINSQEFWEAITRRNSLLIKLRYFAAISLLLALYFAQNILLLNLSDKQFISILLIGLFIITYNFLIHLLRYRAGYGDAKFNKMHCLFANGLGFDNAYRSCVLYRWYRFTFIFVLHFPYDYRKFNTTRLFDLFNLYCSNYSLRNYYFLVSSLIYLKPCYP